MNKTFMLRLRLIRDRHHISRLALSQLCGLYDGAIRAYELGEVVPTADAMEKIADYFGVSVDWLLGREK